MRRRIGGENRCYNLGMASGEGDGMDSQNPYKPPLEPNETGQISRFNEVVRFLITAFFGILTGMAIVGILTLIWVVLTT